MRAEKPWISRWLTVGVFVVSGCCPALAFAGLDQPMATVTATDGKVLVLSAGTMRSVTVVDGDRETGSVPLEDAGLGIAITPNGKMVYASGGARGSVYELSYDGGQLKLVREMKASADAAGFIGDVAVSPDGRLIYATDLFANTVDVINPQSGRVTDRFKTGRRPYHLVFHPDGQSFFVSSWADASVTQYRAINGEELGKLRLGPHPAGMVISNRKLQVDPEQPQPTWKYRLFVTAANTNNVFVIGIGDNNTLKLEETIQIAPAPLAPLGMTPSAIALSQDQTRAYVVCSDADAIAVVDISDVHSVLEGYVTLPKDSYATSVQARANGLLVATAAHASTALVLNAAEPVEIPASVSVSVSAAKADQVVYVVRGRTAEAMLKAVAGVAPDFTVKMGGRQGFKLNDPANLPPAGYLWTNARSAGLSIRNYGVLIQDGQAAEPSLRAVTNPKYNEAKGTEERLQLFLEDWKQLASAGSLPKLTMIQIDGDDALVKRLTEGVRQAKGGAKTEVVVDDLRQAEALLGLLPMTRKD
jgi:YVTN family beta-propeller protein